RCFVMAWRVSLESSASWDIEAGCPEQRRATSASRVLSPRAAKTRALAFGLAVMRLRVLRDMAIDNRTGQEVAELGGCMSIESGDQTEPLRRLEKLAKRLAGSRAVLLGAGSAGPTAASGTDTALFASGSTAFTGFEAAGGLRSGARARGMRSGGARP